MIYKDRQDAGKQLAERLKKYANENPIIMALPRGGVILGSEVAKKLNAPFDVIVSRKIGAPQDPEFAIGAIAPKLIIILNDEMIKHLNISEEAVDQIIQKETIEMNRQINLYRKDLPDIDLEGKTVIIVDDGIATGLTTQAALLSIKSLKPNKIILAVPVCPLDSKEKFEQHVDEFICVETISDFHAVCAYYDNFEQVTDDEVINLLKKQNL